MIDVSKVCSPTEHEAAKADPVRWAQLAPTCERFRIVMDYGDGEREVLEYRQCACNSTLTKRIEVRS